MGKRGAGGVSLPRSRLYAGSARSTGRAWLWPAWDFYIVGKMFPTDMDGPIVLALQQTVAAGSRVAGIRAFSSVREK